MTHNKGLTLQIEVRLDVALSKVRRLSTQQRNIVCTLHEHPGLCNKEIARYCFASEETVASQLGILEEKGILSKSKLGTEKDGRKTFWNICDKEISAAMTLKYLQPGQSIGWEEEDYID